MASGVRHEGSRDRERPAVSRRPDRHRRRLGAAGRDRARHAHARAAGRPQSRWSPISAAARTALRIGPDGAVYVCNNGGFQLDARGRRLRIRPIARPTTTRAAASSASTSPPAASSASTTRVDGQPLRGPNDIVFDAARRLLLHRPRQGRAQRDMDRGGVLLRRARRLVGQRDRTAGDDAERHRPVARRHARSTSPRPRARGCGRSTSTAPGVVRKAAGPRRTAAG